MPAKSAKTRRVDAPVWGTRGPNSGVFLQIICDDPADIGVPAHSYSFGAVKARRQAVTSTSWCNSVAARCASISRMSMQDWGAELARAIGMTLE
jgi:transaldolase/glucose-6-phosphate isomerase